MRVEDHQAAKDGEQMAVAYRTIMRLGANVEHLEQAWSELPARVFRTDDQVRLRVAAVMADAAKLAQTLDPDTGLAERIDPGRSSTKHSKMDDRYRKGTR